MSATAVAPFVTHIACPSHPGHRGRTRRGVMPGCGWAWACAKPVASLRTHSGVLLLQPPLGVCPVPSPTPGPGSQALGPPCSPFPRGPAVPGPGRGLFHSGTSAAFCPKTPPATRPRLPSPPPPGPGEHSDCIKVTLRSRSTDRKGLAPGPATFRGQSWGLSLLGLAEGGLPSPARREHHPNP